MKTLHILIASAALLMKSRAMGRLRRTVANNSGRASISLRAVSHATTLGTPRSQGAAGVV